MSLINYFRRFRRPLFSVRIKGTSMMPELIPNKLYLASSLKKPKIGSNIVFKNPKNITQMLVKKVHTASDDNSYYVNGAVSWATSSSQIGLIKQSEIIGIIL